MREHSDHGLVVLVKEESLALELRKDCLHVVTYHLQLFEGDVFLKVRGSLEAPGLYAVVQHYSPSVAARVAMDIGVLDGLLDGGSLWREGT